MLPKDFQILLQSNENTKAVQSVWWSPNPLWTLCDDVYFNSLFHFGLKHSVYLDIHYMSVDESLINSKYMNKSMNNISYI